MRPLGSTDLRVSDIGMGTIQLTRLEWGQSIRVVHEVMDLGVNWFDTAHDYLDSELRLGDAFVGRRNRVVLITKSGEKTPEKIEEQLNESLSRLKTDYVDVFFFHGGDVIEQDNFLTPGGILETAQRAVEAGKVRFLGFSAHRPEVALKGLEHDILQVAMIPANFISREYIDGPFMELARQKNVAVLAMKPFGGGRIPATAAALKFLKNYPDLLPCIGIEKSAEMEQNIKVWRNDQGLTAEEEVEIERQTNLLGDRFCRSCGYCLPCPEEIPIPSVTFLKVFSEQIPKDQVVTEKHDRQVELAKTCTECGQCVERCPYSLDVPEMLKDNVRFYEEFAAT